MNISKKLLPVLMVVSGFVYAGNDKYFTPEYIPALNKDLAAAKARFEELEAHCAQCQNGSAEYQENNCSPVDMYNFRLKCLQGYYDRHRDDQKRAKKAKSVLPEEYENAKAERKNFKKEILKYFEKNNRLPEEFK